MNDDKSARDNDMTHLSTWMVIVNQPNLSQSLAANSGKESLPISLKLNYAGNAIQRNVYTSMTVKELMQEASALSSIEFAILKLEDVQDIRKTRLDMLVYEKSTVTLPEEMRVLQTLCEAKVAHNAVIFVGEKEEGDDKIVESSNTNATTISTATTIATHTVVASYSEAPNDDKQIVVDLEWTLTKLLKTM